MNPETDFAGERQSNLHVAQRISVITSNKKCPPEDGLIEGRNM
jgi:hypothetical protein